MSFAKESMEKDDYEFESGKKFSFFYQHLHVLFVHINEKCLTRHQEAACRGHGRNAGGWGKRSGDHLHWNGLCYSRRNERNQKCHFNCQSDRKSVMHMDINGIIFV